MGAHAEGADRSCTGTRSSCVKAAGSRVFNWWKNMGVSAAAEAAVVAVSGDGTGAASLSPPKKWTMQSRR